MYKNIELTENGIKALLDTNNINKEEETDIYLKIIDFKLLYEKNSLYICSMKDKNTSYDSFILKSNQQLEKDSIIHAKKVRVTISGQKKNVSILNYENFGQIKTEEINEEEKRNRNDEEDKDIFEEELNEQTRKLFENLNLKHKKKKQKCFFKWDKGNMKILDNKLKKKQKFSSVKKNIVQEEKKRDNINEDNSAKIEDIYNDNILKEEKGENEDKEEIEKIFNGININEIFDINQAGDDIKIDEENKLQLIINLSTNIKGQPLYVKCISKLKVDKEKKKYIAFIFRDPEGAEINAYVYGKLINDMDVKIVQNGVYIISDYLVKPKISSALLTCDFRLVFMKRTKIESLPPDSIFNNIHFHFLNIDELFYFREGTIVDVCGIICEEGKIEVLNTKFGYKMLRTILILDNSLKKIYISVWEPVCQNDRIKFEKGEIIAFKYCKLFIFPSKIKKLETTSLTLAQNSTSDFEKDTLLKEFYDKHNDINEYSFVLNPPNYKYLEQLKKQILYNLENNIENCYVPFLTKGYIEDIALDDKSIYNGCPLCNKKLKELEENDEDYNENAKYKCYLCQKQFVEPKYIYKLSFTVRDANSKVFFNMIGDEATKFLETEPYIVKHYLDEKNYEELKKIENKVLFQEYIFMGTLTSYPNYKGRITNKARVENIEKAEGQNLKRILQLIDEEAE